MIAWDMLALIRIIKCRIVLLVQPLENDFHRQARSFKRLHARTVAPISTHSLTLDHAIQPLIMHTLLCHPRKTCRIYLASQENIP